LIHCFSENIPAILVSVSPTSTRTLNFVTFATSIGVK
jgi:hypothetical protein